MNKYLIAILLLTTANIAVCQEEYEDPMPSKHELPSEVETPDKPVSKDSISIEEKKEKERKINPSGMSEFRRNFRIGGGFNLSSTYYSSPSYEGQLLVAGISPQFTYVLSKYFEGGISLSYNYLGSFGDLNVHSYSFGPIMRAYPFESIFLQIEGIFFQNQTIFRGYTEKSQDINAYVGGGIISRFSERAYVVTGIEVNLIKNSYTYDQIIPIPFTSFHFGI